MKDTLLDYCKSNTSNQLLSFIKNKAALLRS